MLLITFSLPSFYAAMYCMLLSIFTGYRLRIGWLLKVHRSSSRHVILSHLKLTLRLVMVIMMMMVWWWP